MNCIIGADNVNCKLLVEFAGRSSSLNLVGTFTDSMSVRNQLLKQRDIDLLFLDIEILETDCIDFINSLNYKPNVIILSSSDLFAIKAFDISVVDYLLKPITYSRFCRAVDKALKFYSRREISIDSDNEIFIKKESSLIKLKLKDIIYIEALENYVTLATIDKKFTIHFTMKAIENHLPPEIFIRVHRSFIVNKGMIQTIQENSLDLIVGDTIKNFPVGKSFRDLLLNNINMMSR
ncbi:MAG: LytTR family DNA-binding domain-containing protein [Bacteroidales bacterium]|jgi:DNA-binding LytR/AlgR family response regulator